MCVCVCEGERDNVRVCVLLLVRSFFSSIPQCALLSWLACRLLPGCHRRLSVVEPFPSAAIAALVHENIPCCSSRNTRNVHRVAHSTTFLYQLHHGVIRSTAALGHCPADVLARVLDAAGLAVQAVLRVDRQLLLLLLLVSPCCCLVSCYVLIHARRAVPGAAVQVLMWCVARQQMQTHTRGEAEGCGCV